MSSASWPPKGPNERLDYSYNWSPLLIDGDEIESVEWEIPEDIVQEAPSNTATIATVWLSGGTNGSNYTIGCRITTTDGRVIDRSIILRVRTQ